MKFNRILALFILLCSLSACNKDDMFLPDLTGSIVGYVYTFDEFGNLLEDHSGVKVLALGNKQYSATTSVAGRFELKGVPAGTYDLQIEKKGFGTMKQFGIKHLGGEPTILGLNRQDGILPESFFIYKMPSTEILDLQIEKDTIYGSFAFTGQEPAMLQLLLYFSTKQDFLVSEAEDFAIRPLDSLNGQYSGKLFGNGNIDFQKGEVVYCKGFMYADRSGIEIYENHISGINTYFDYDSNETVYPNIGDESEQFSFIFE